MIPNGGLHYAIVRFVIDRGFAPDVPTLATLLGATGEEVERALHGLAEDHGVVLHPHAPKVWVIHPFSLAPTNFLVKTADRMWWGNCAWCSLGIAALVPEDVTITTRLGAHDEQIVLHIENGEVREKDLVIHFPIAMRHAWDNVIYTCSNMLVFRNEEEVEAWSRRHDVPRGDVQPIANVWAFAKKWYGRHLDPDWRKWTMQEAKALFAEFALTGPIWDLDTTGERF